jgi:hypothetical protein
MFESPDLEHLAISDRFGIWVTRPPAVGQPLAVRSHGVRGFPGLKIETWGTRLSSNSAAVIVLLHFG